MANDLKTRPFTLDTAGTTVLFPGEIHIFHFEFVDYTADAHTCVVKDRNGKVVWSGNGAADLQPIRSGNVGWISGLVLSTLDSGAVRVYYK